MISITSSIPWLSRADSAEWKAFKVQTKKHYGNDAEESAKMKTWLANRAVVTAHNKKFAEGKVSYRMAINRFSDMTPAELNKAVTNLKMSNSSEIRSGPFVKYVVFEPTGRLPDSKDWRNDGAVTAVKDQGMCGSCYALSVTGAVEGQYFLATRKLVSLSEQQIVDCSLNYGNFGCEGGLMHSTYKFIRDIGGLETAKSYPYQGIEQSCKFNKKSAAATVESYVFVEKNEKALMNAVALVGPISVGISVQDSFAYYRSGIYDDPTCPTKKINHGVLVVGYGTENGKDFWIVKNSWVSSTSNITLTM